MRRFWTPLKVGVLTVFGVGALVVSLAEVTKGGLSEADSYEVFAIFDDAIGLEPKSRVQIAGIDVGQIDHIELVGSRAKVTLRIKNAIVLYTDARVAKRSEGFLGDMSLDIYPGSDTSPRIPPGGEIKNVVSAGGMDQVFETLGTITGDIQVVTAQLKTIIEESGKGIPKLVKDMGTLAESVNFTIVETSRKLDAILGDIAEFTTKVTQVAGDETRTVQNILHNVEVVSKDLQSVVKDVDSVLDTVKEVLGTSDESLKEGVSSLRTSLTKLNDSLEKVNVVTGHLSEGQSTVSRLLTDDTLIRQVEETVDDVADIVDRVAKLQTEVSLRSEVHYGKRTARNALQLRLIPKEDKWYEMAVVDPAANPVEAEIKRVEVGGVPTETTTLTSKDVLQFNLLYAHRWRFRAFSLTGKFGLIQNSGAFAGDVGLFGDQLLLSVEIFDFSNPTKDLPRLRAFGTVTFLNHLFITGGVDDALNSRFSAQPPGAPVGLIPRDYFLGAGFYFTDQDLKAILTTVGVPGG